MPAQSRASVRVEKRPCADGWLGRERVGTTLTALINDLPAALRHLRAAHPTIGGVPARPDIIVLPLQPPLPCTLGLIEHGRVANDARRAPTSAGHAVPWPTTPP